MNKCNLERFYLIHTWEFDLEVTLNYMIRHNLNLTLDCLPAVHVLDRDSHWFRYFIYDLCPLINIYYYNSNLIRSVGSLPVDRRGSPDQTWQNGRSASRLIWWSVPINKMWSGTLDQVTVIMKNIIYPSNINKKPWNKYLGSTVRR